MLEKLYSFLYCSWVENSYKLISSKDKEEVYFTKSKLVVILKDKTLGEKIFDIISFLSDSCKIIRIKDMSFRISDYIAIEGVITYFSIIIPDEFDWEKFEKMEKLHKIVLFISEMSKQGCFLDESKFEFKDFDTISEIFSFFTKDSEIENKTSELLIKYCHYFLSGVNDFEDFYSRIDNQIFFEVSEMPYCFQIVRMCYKYYLTGYIPDNIYEVLTNEDYKGYDGYLVVKNNGWKDCSADEENDEYSLYGDIKIFNKIPENFKRFLLYDYDENDIRTLCKEKSEERIIDLDGRIVGYKTTSNLDESSILDTVITEQQKFFEFFEKFMTFILNTKRIRNYENTSFEVELDKIIVCSDNENFEFQFKTFSQLFNFFGMSARMISEQLAEIFCKMYKNFVDLVYGEANSQEELLERIEVRYLSPILIKGFINFYFEKDTDLIQIFNELQLFIFSKKKIDKQHDLFYDSRFEYNPFVIPFYFNYEIERKYGIKLKTNMQKKLSDERIIVMFSYPKSIDAFAKNNEHILELIEDKIGNIESEHLKFIGISEIIYSKEIDSNGTYSCIGVVTTPVKGEVLTKKKLLSFNNKELMYVFGYYFANFSYYTFYLKNVRLDNNFVFYIDVLDEEFRLKETMCESNKDYLKKKIKSLTNLGYNLNAFVGLELNSTSIYNYSRYFIELANSFEHYCNEHGIYYAGKACPVCLKLNYYLTDEIMGCARLVFEDNIAKHYKISDEYNLKLYKPEVINIDEMERRVDGIVRAGVDSNFDSYNYGQDCFIPVKKAYNDHKQFVGYIYETVNFNGESNNLCVDLKDLERIKNLPRLKALIRLLLQVQTLLKNNLTFSRNPYGSVFLNRDHKKQVQIINIEFIDIRENKSEIINWTCEYVLSVIKSDETLQLVNEDENKIMQLIKKIQTISNVKLNNLDSLLNKLEKTVARMTKYCDVHRLYYDEEYIFCPKCLGVADIESLKIKYVSKKDITSREKINEGGEAIIYKYDNGNVAKVFRESGDINYGLKSIIIARVMQRAEALKNTMYTAQYEYVIPEKILVDNNQMYAYVMKEVHGLPLSVLKDKQVVRKMGFTKKDILEILIAVGKGIEGLHNNNIFIGDLNGRNILFNTSKRVFFLDFDGMGADDISPEFCTDGYIDPISKKKQMITKKDDWYSFAVQAFYYLTYTHPFNGIYEENERLLDIPTKMERRISLLGKHGMNIPVIAEPWDWMSAELKNTFYQIFENEMRVSIVPYLIDQYNHMYSGENNSLNEKWCRVNQKFIAEESNPFYDENIIYVVNLNVAACERNNQKYAIVLTDNHRYVLENIPCFESPKLIKDVLITEDENYAFVIVTSRLFVVDLKKDACIESKSLINDNCVVVNGNSVYYMDVHKGMPVISKKTLTSGGEIEKDWFKFSDEQQIPKCFAVAFNSKFVIVQKSYEDSDIIYCNDSKFCDIDCKYSNTKYNILYDKLSNTWLVINEEGYIVVIKQDRTYDKFKVDDNIKISVKNVTYINGNLYIPNNECLWIISVKNQYKCKKMECYKIMDSASKICKINRNGFTLVTNGKLYNVYRD